MPDINVKSHTLYEPVQGSAVIPLLSSPFYFGENPKDKDLHKSYIQVNRLRTDYWRVLFKKNYSKCLKVALVWQGNPKAERTINRGRSIPLRMLEPLSDIPNVVFVALQKGYGVEQFSEITFTEKFVNFQTKVFNALDFEDTAAILNCCDLLITIDTVVAHIGGALGMPVWLLLAHQPDWRWGSQGENTFWYENLCTYKQGVAGDWDGVIKRVKAELNALAKRTN
jgi:hypothetical protein